MNAYSNNEENNDQVAPDPPKNDEIRNANSDKVTPDTSKNGGNDEKIDNNAEKTTKTKLRRKQMIKT